MDEKELICYFMFAFHKKNTNNSHEGLIGYWTLLFLSIQMFGVLEINFSQKRLIIITSKSLIYLTIMLNFIFNRCVNLYIKKYDRSDTKLKF